MGFVLTLTISMLLLSLMAYISTPIGCTYKEYIDLLFAMYALAHIYKLKVVAIVT